MARPSGFFYGGIKCQFSDCAITLCIIYTIKVYIEDKNIKLAVIRAMPEKHRTNVLKYLQNAKNLQNLS